MSFATQVSLYVLLVALTVVPTSARAQGTFVYDQSSSIESNPGEFSVNIQNTQPMGQSFIPTLGEIGFIRLRILNFNVTGSLFVNLRENSITGGVLAASSPATIANSFVGYVDFFFQPGTTLSPGTTYFLQPSVITGPGLFAGSHNGFGYPGGTAFLNGEADRFNNDLWFREGLYIPEPSVLALVGLTTVCFIFRRHKTDR